MSDASHEARRGPSHRNVEVAVALIMAAFGVLAMAGSYQVGIGWGVEGPKAGFFPFYVGLVIVGSSAINLFNALKENPKQLFADWGQLRAVMSIVIPTAVYVAVMPFTGLYVSSLVLIAFFMKWLGRYSWVLTLSIAIGVPLVTFVLFEKWFLVPLPKGPIEELLGF
ncbi:tripartite tricarboxylate transporter TctB family protein [Leptospira sp. severe_002]|uniref:tripartite tricarboxylate transporter TctB family protein n=1 Tax=Leptospira sp. severe_002 TaxID=2838237 RepID=UPI001E30D06A|nr:tripartite tricarboxylate transporter TctB family protein [Leptospira sp. severe_002]